MFFFFFFFCTSNAISQRAVLVPSANSIQASHNHHTWRVCTQHQFPTQHLVHYSGKQSFIHNLNIMFQYSLIVGNVTGLICIQKFLKMNSQIQEIFYKHSWIVNRLVIFLPIRFDAFNVDNLKLLQHDVIQQWTQLVYTQAVSEIFPYIVHYLKGQSFYSGVQNYIEHYQVHSFHPTLHSKNKHTTNVHSLLEQASPTLLLESCLSADFSYNPASTPAFHFYVTLNTMINWFRCACDWV